jgi:hypothetical protein
MAAYLARSVLGPPAHVGLCPRLEKVNGMIRGMLSGTQTFEDAFCKMVQCLFLDFVTACEPDPDDGDACGGARRDPGAVQHRRSRGPVRACSESYRRLGAGDLRRRSAFFAPTLGPATPAAAAGVATGASATVLAGLPAFDIGSWSVPRTIAAFVHQGEMILPAGMAEAIRGGGQGGEVQSTFTISSALDGSRPTRITF